MVNRINLILRAKNITARQFAEEIGIQPSGMSHIMSGRNNPSLDFVTKVIRRYPEIDANWLIMGRGEMYAAAGNRPVETEVMKEDNVEPATLFSDVLEPEVEPDPAPGVPSKPYNQDDNFAEENKNTRVGEPGNYSPTYFAVPPEAEPSSVANHGRRLVRMLFIYSDNTFREFLPAE